MISNDLQTTLNALPQPAMLVDSERHIFFANPASAKLFGDELEGLQFVRVLRHPEALMCLDSALAGAEQEQTEFQLSGNHTISLLMTASYLSDQDSAAVSFRDVTPLLQAAQMRSDFVANVSHELRSPLTTLSGLIETLRNSARDDPCLLYTSPSPRDKRQSRMPSSA